MMRTFTHVPNSNGSAPFDDHVVEYGAAFLEDTHMTRDGLPMQAALSSTWANPRWWVMVEVPGQYN
jgi:hypothetical protein